MKKILINLHISLFLLIIIGITTSGCFIGGFRNSANPAASTVTQNKTESPVQSGSANISLVIAVPEGWKQTDENKPSFAIDPTFRSSVTKPYAKAELYYGYLSRPNGQVLSQVKTAPVENGATSITFNGVMNKTNVIVRLELIGCSIYGVRKFEGEVFTHKIDGNFVVLHTASGEAPNKTLDGKLLVEIGQPNNLGRVISLGLVFNELGQPIGSSPEGFLTNFETGQKYFHWQDLEHSTPWLTNSTIYNGHLYTAERTVAKISMNGEVVAKYERLAELGNTVSGSFDETIIFKHIAGLATHDGALYIFNDWSQLVKIKDGYATVLFTGHGWQRGGSILDNGEIWLFLAPASSYGEYTAFKMSTEGEILVKLPLRGTPNSAIKYGDGVLFATHFGIYLWDGTNVSDWLTPYLVESNGYALPGHFNIYKNNAGIIYVVSHYLHKIWRVE